jgi:hypothetical protein
MFSCVSSGRLFHFIGLSCRRGRRFLVNGWSIGLSQHLKSGSFNCPLTLGRHTNVVAIETSREHCLSAICSRPIFYGSAICHFRGLLLRFSRRSLLTQFKVTRWANVDLGRGELKIEIPFHENDILVAACTGGLLGMVLLNQIIMALKVCLLLHRHLKHA